jgi:enolase
MKIEHIVARQIIDSRGNPTVEADVYVSGGIMGRAAVPSGASTGSHEARELRDGGVAFHGLGVQKAIDNISQIITPALMSMDVSNQQSLDNRLIELDGTNNKEKLGANALLAISLAAAHAAARAAGIPLYKHINLLADSPTMNVPLPMMNVLNGGAHAAHSTDIQESMIMPVGASSIHQAIQIGCEVFHALKDLLQEAGYSTTVGDEGGFAPHFSHGNAEALDFLVQAIQKAGYDTHKDFKLALDVAASELYQNGTYHLASEQKNFTSSDMRLWLASLVDKYPIISIEDGLSEDDWAEWKQLLSDLPQTQIVGDDLLVTNVARIQKAVEQQAANAVLIKPNQIGTLTETINAILFAKKHHLQTIISHRSGETEDTTIAHLAVGTGAGQIKTGSVSRSERVAKYNELIRIAEADPSLPFSSFNL